MIWLNLSLYSLYCEWSEWLQVFIKVPYNFCCFCFLIDIVFIGACLLISFSSSPWNISYIWLTFLPEFTFSSSCKLLASFMKSSTLNLEKSLVFRFDHDFENWNFLIKRKFGKWSVIWGIRLPLVYSYSKLFLKILSMSVDLPDGKKWVGWLEKIWKHHGKEIICV